MECLTTYFILWYSGFFRLVRRARLPRTTAGCWPWVLRMLWICAFWTQITYVPEVILHTLLELIDFLVEDTLEICRVYLGGTCCCSLRLPANRLSILSFNQAGLRESNPWTWHLHSGMPRLKMLYPLPGALARDVRLWGRSRHFLIFNAHQYFLI